MCDVKAHRVRSVVWPTHMWGSYMEAFFYHYYYYYCRYCYHYYHHYYVISLLNFSFV